MLHRLARALSLVSLAGCASSAPSASPPSSTASAGPVAPQAEPTLSGTIGGRPFVARSALMVRANADGRKCSTALTGTGKCSSDSDGWPIKTSVLRVFERSVTCANLGDARGRRDVQLASGEHSIDFLIEATWPVFPGSTWQTHEREPTKDQIGVTFRREGAGGAIAQGTMQFLAATATSGVIAMRLAATNPSLESSGSVSGTIPFTVCP